MSLIVSNKTIDQSLTHCFSTSATPTKHSPDVPSPKVLAAQNVGTGPYLPIAAKPSHVTQPQAHERPEVGEWQHS